MVKSEHNRKFLLKDVSFVSLCQMVDGNSRQWWRAFHGRAIDALLWWCGFESEWGGTSGHVRWRLYFVRYGIWVWSSLFVRWECCCIARNTLPCHRPDYDFCNSVPNPTTHTWCSMKPPDQKNKTDVLCLSIHHVDQNLILTVMAVVPLDLRRWSAAIGPREISNLLLPPHFYTHNSNPTCSKNATLRAAFKFETWMTRWDYGVLDRCTYSTWNG